MKIDTRVKPQLPKNGSPMKNQQKGVALLVILMVISMMVTIAGTMSGRLFNQFKRASNQINYQQAFAYSLGAEALAKAALKESMKSSSTINLEQPWAMQAQTYPLDYGTIEGQIYDKQACFNLNVLATAKLEDNLEKRPYVVKTLAQLLEMLSVDNREAEGLADSAWEYINTATNQVSDSGVDKSTYESFKPAYLAPGYMLADASELRAISGVSAQLFVKLKPYLCAIPTTRWELNINTLPREKAALLAALFFPYLDEENAAQLIDQRPSSGWDSVDELLAEPAFTTIDAKIRQQARNHLSVTSKYFELDTEILVDKARLRVRSLLYTKDKDNVTVIRRRYGGISDRVSGGSIKQ